MKWLLIILLFVGCTTVYSVTLDCSPSYVSGGRGNGYFTKYEWKGDGLVYDDSPVVKAVGITRGSHQWQVIVTDNLGNKDSSIIKVDVK